MDYPTYKEIDDASHVQLAKWHRFLPSPGQNHIGKIDFEKHWQNEVDKMEFIRTRLYCVFGGISSSVPKHIGWDAP